MIQNVSLLLLLLSLISSKATAQKSYLYEFQNNFFESSSNGPALSILGEQGTFTSEIFPEFGGIKRTVYSFTKNSGLKFNLKDSQIDFTKNYTIEIYFKFDSLNSWKRVIDFKERTTDNGAYIYFGKLNFYKIAVSENAPFSPGIYTHYILTYQAATKQVSISANGIEKLTFTDKENDAQFSSNVIHFFFDDLIVKNEASSGSVAFIKLYDYPMPPNEIKNKFNELVQTIDYPNKGKHLLTLQVFDAESKKPLKSEIEIMKKNSGEIIASSHQATKKQLKLNTEVYQITVASEGYFKNTFDLSLVYDESKSIYLTRPRLNETVALERVQFKQGTTELLTDSYGPLTNLAHFLLDHPMYTLELSGHTDNVGDAEKNLKLSQDRVQFIKAYLVKLGVDMSRITGTGYGGEMPIASNESEETRKLNRRVEFKIKTK